LILLINRHSAEVSRRRIERAVASLSAIDDGGEGRGSRDRKDCDTLAAWLANAL
jgi:hypothetical protein